MKSVTKWMVAAVGMVGALGVAQPASAEIFHVLYSQVGTMRPSVLRVFATESECRERAQVVAEGYIENHREPKLTSSGNYSHGISRVEPMAAGIVVYERIQLQGGQMTTLRAALYCTPYLSP